MPESPMGYNSTDTSPEVSEVQIAAWRRMGPAQRFNLALELSQVSREIALDGLRARHPNESSDVLHRRLTEVL